ADGKATRGTLPNTRGSRGSAALPGARPAVNTTVGSSVAFTSHAIAGRGAVGRAAPHSAGDVVHCGRPGRAASTERTRGLGQGRPLHARWPTSVDREP